MKILLLAPHPFFQERGTPIAVNLLIQSLSESGHQVDVLCFPEGEDVCYPGVRLHRTTRPGSFQNIPPGLSFKKLVCDFFMVWKAIGLVRRIRPDVIHAVEESVFIARILSLLFGVPYLFDMDSSIPDQIVEKYPRMAFLRWPMHRLLGLAVAGAMMVVPVCDSLADTAEEQYRSRRIMVLHDISLLKRRVAGQLKISTELRAGGTVFMYAGNMEGYQGVDLMMEAFAKHAKSKPRDVLALIGGTPSHLGQYREKARQLGCAEQIRFLGPQPSQDLAAFLDFADVLISPRIKGFNTPMKIYSYLDSGKAILATDLPTHTQVLDPTVACLTPPTADAMAAAMTRLSADESYRAQLGLAGRKLAVEKYSYESFHRKVDEIYSIVQQEIHPRPGAASIPSQV